MLGIGSLQEFEEAIEQGDILLGRDDTFLAVLAQYTSAYTQSPLSVPCAQSWQ